jgi:hypothetical protein
MADASTSIHSESYTDAPSTNLDYSSDILFDPFMNSSLNEDNPNRIIDDGDEDDDECMDEEDHEPSEDESSSSELDDEDGDNDSEIPIVEGVLPKYFESLQQRIRNAQDVQEYARGTFWITPEQPFFALQKQKKLNPDVLYHPRVFIWIPHKLLPRDQKLRCPHPNCNQELETKGFNKKPHVRRVVDIDRYGNETLILMQYVQDIDPSI